MGEVVWGPGAKGVVTVDYVDGDTIGVRGWGLISADVLSPLPPLLTPEAQAVLDAVTVWREEDPNVGACYLLKAHDAYIASITPPHPRWKPRDPLDVAKEALEEIAGIADSLSIGSKNWAKAALEKIAALEADAKEGGRAMSKELFASVEAEICAEILEIMNEYDRQNEKGFIDTPGGLEHMGDVWSLFRDWERRLKA